MGPDYRISSTLKCDFRMKTAELQSKNRNALIAGTQFIFKLNLKKNPRICARLKLGSDFDDKLLLY